MQTSRPPRPQRASAGLTFFPPLPYRQASLNFGWPAHGSYPSVSTLILATRSVRATVFSVALTEIPVGAADYHKRALGNTIKTVVMLPMAGGPVFLHSPHTVDCRHVPANTFAPSLLSARHHPIRPTHSILFKMQSGHVANFSKFRSKTTRHCPPSTSKKL